MKVTPLIIAVILASLTGCATFEAGKLENRVTVTLPCDRAFFASLYGPFGLTSEIDKKDVAMLCASRAAPTPAAAASGAK